MVRITKVYTRTGDDGKTSLAGGQRIAKTSTRIEAYGTIDELNAHLGLVAETLRADSDGKALLSSILIIQNELFDLGAQLAVLPENRREDTPRIYPEQVRRLEKEMDEFNSQLPALKSFVLPGGGELAARLHVARTVCRRAERELLRLHDAEPLSEQEIAYLNRLSDWLFVAARFAAKLSAVPETLWRPGGSRASNP